MSLKITASVIAASFVIASLAASVEASAAAGNKYQSPLARNGIDVSQRLSSYAGPEPFAPVHHPRPAYTLNHDAWMSAGGW
jgi:hypothetical protein